MRDDDGHDHDRESADAEFREGEAGGDPSETLAAMVEWLRTEPTTSKGFEAWWLGAARAAGLGRHEPFLRWPAIASRIGVSAEVAIKRVCGSVLERLEGPIGMDGDRAVVDAEDLACLQSVEPVTTALLAWPNGWVRMAVAAAESRALCAAGVETIRRHAVMFPLSEAMRLPVVALPLEPIDLMAGARRPGPVQVLAEVALVSETELVSFDDGRPSPRMIERFARRRGEGVTPTGRLFRAEPVLDRWWGVRVRVEGDGAGGVSDARLGSLRMTRHPGENGDWHFEASLAGMTPDVQSRLLCSQLMLRSRDGGRFTV